MDSFIRFKTVKKSLSSELIIEKSRFICHTCRVSTEDDVRSFISAVKKRYWDATHNCSAYVIGERFQIQRSSDDGEPSGTAGIPMLEVLKKRGLTDTAVVVTRYFGGVKLGAGGLIRAYGKSVSLALDEAGTVAVTEQTCLKIAFDYASFQKIESQITKTSYTIDSSEYSDTVEAVICCVPAEISSLKTWVSNMTNGKARILFEEARLVERDETYSE